MPTAVYVRTDTDRGFPVDVIELHTPDGTWYEAEGFGVDELLAERQNLVAGEWVDRDSFLLCGFGLQNHMLPPENTIEVRLNRSYFPEDPPEVRLTRVGVRLWQVGAGDDFHGPVAPIPAGESFICWSAPFPLEGPSTPDEPRATRNERIP